MTHRRTSSRTLRIATTIVRISIIRKHNLKVKYSTVVSQEGFKFNSIQGSRSSFLFVVRVLVLAFFSLVWVQFEDDSGSSSPKHCAFFTYRLRIIHASRETRLFVNSTWKSFQFDFLPRVRKCADAHASWKSSSSVQGHFYLMD